MKAYPSRDELATVFSYDPESGKLFRDGRESGSRTSLGYTVVCLKGRRYMAHVVAWVLTHGYRPEVVDHVNGARSDNRLANLRPANRSQNRANSNTNRGNKYPKGVRKDPRCRRYHAAVSVNGKAKHLGMFDTVEEAHAAYKRAASVLFGEFCRV